MNEDQQKPSIEGELTHVMEKMSFDSGFEKQDIVVTTGGEFSQPIKMTLIKEKMKALDHVGIGDKVRAFYNIRGREHEGKFYTDINAWRIEKI